MTLRDFLVFKQKHSIEASLILNPDLIETREMQGRKLQQIQPKNLLLAEKIINEIQKTRYANLFQHEFAGIENEQSDSEKNKSYVCLKSIRVI